MSCQNAKIGLRRAQPLSRSLFRNARAVDAVTDFCEVDYNAGRGVPRWDGHEIRPHGGIGEQKEELSAVMNELRAAGCSILSIGQYLQPTKNHWPVIRFYEPQEFELLKQEGLALGFRHVEAGPLVRSSYHAAEQTVTPSPVTPPLS
jgi:hypothetical protein